MNPQELRDAAGASLVRNGRLADVVPASEGTILDRAVGILEGGLEAALR